jgi:hypothetical protein
MKTMLTNNDGLIIAKYSQYPADLVGGKPITDQKKDIPGIPTQQGLPLSRFVHGKSTIGLDSLALTDNEQVMKRIRLLLEDYRRRITYERESGIGGENE